MTERSGLLRGRLFVVRGARRPVADAMMVFTEEREGKGKRRRTYSNVIGGSLASTSRLDSWCVKLGPRHRELERWLFSPLDFLFSLLGKSESRDRERVRARKSDARGSGPPRRSRRFLPRSGMPVDA